MNESPETHCGFIAILGAPNVGKSTLLNRVVGTKVSIVSSKVQTTRTRILGIALVENSQLIFIDTPGIFNPKRRLDRAMIAAAWGGARDADRIILLVDSKRGVDINTEIIIDKLKQNGFDNLDLVLNKIDLINKQDLLKLTKRLNNYGIFKEIFMVSAEKGDGVSDLISYLRSKIPVSPWLFPQDQISDMPMRLLAAEITREKLFMKLHQELPYAITLETENWQKRDDQSIRIEQTIYVERDSQRSIVLGKNGQMIKLIGMESRKELSEVVDAKVHLFLFVKVREKWGDDPSHYTNWGLDFNV